MQSDHDFLKWFRSAAPYIHAHRGGTIVLQMDGEAVAAESFPALIHDLALLNSLAIRLVVVFGAAPQIDGLLKRHGITPQYKGGLRVTDRQLIESVKQAVGEIRIQIEALFSMGLPNSPMAKSRIRTASGNYVTAKPYGVIDGVDLQLTGCARKIDERAIRMRLDAGDIVLVPPLGYSITGEIFNLASIELAAQLAQALAADKLIMLGNGPVLTDDAGETIRQITCREVGEKLLAKTDATDKTALALKQGIKACEKGVKRVHFIDRNINGGVLRELFTRDGVGTLMSDEPFDAIRQAGVDDIGGILELINPLEEQGILVERSCEKIEADIERYIVLARDGAVIACAALHDYPDDNAMELACLVVHPEYQNQGKGDILYRYIESVARKHKAGVLFILTTRAEHWFIEKGFIEADIDTLPLQKQNIYSHQRNSKVLIKNLTRLPVDCAPKGHI